MSHKFYNLTKNEIGIVKNCMKAAAMENFFPEWEFQTLFGINREELNHVISIFPDVDLNKDIHRAAVFNSMLHLLGYPHGQETALEKITSVDARTILLIMKKLRQRFNDKTKKNTSF